MMHTLSSFSSPLMLWPASSVPTALLVSSRHPSIPELKSLMTLDLHFPRVSSGSSRNPCQLPLLNNVISPSHRWSLLSVIELSSRVIHGHVRSPFGWSAGCWYRGCVRRCMTSQKKVIGSVGTACTRCLHRWKGLYLRAWHVQLHP